MRVRLALFAAVTLLAVSNVVSNRLWPEGYLVWNLGMTGVLLVVARLAGVAWADLGLHGLRLRRGLVIGALAVAAVALVYAAAVALPATRTAFVDSRGAVPLAAVLFVALVRIPLGTVVLEELAFRGVLPALVGGGWWRATLVSSGLFGLWHVLPSMGSGSAVTNTLGTHRGGGRDGAVHDGGRGDVPRLAAVERAPRHADAAARRDQLAGRADRLVGHAPPPSLTPRAPPHPRVARSGTAS